MRLSLLLTAFLLASCSIQAPVSHPETNLPPEYKESGIWKHARPLAHVPRGEWWSIFHDRELGALIQRVNVSNQSLKVSVANAEQSAALIKSARLAFLPSLDANASVLRSGGASSSGGDSGVRTQRTIGASTSWEIDLWGRLRHAARATTADAEAAAADVESLELSLQAQTAQTYFSLRAVDAQRDLLNRQIESYQRSLDLTRNRYTQGVASRGDVAQAETQLASTRAAEIELGLQRATLEHALAVLVGETPLGLSVGKGPLAQRVPSVATGTPSRLLERRPDIAAAERRVAAANERIGAARAAFFPSLTLDADGGWRGTSGLFTSATRFWSLGPTLAAPLFDRGQRLAAKAQADAAYEGTVAQYRQTVLTAMQETEDALATLRLLAREADAQEQAVRAARENERITLNQYKAGTVSYLNVAVAQAAALTAERSSLDLQARRLNAAVALVKALGGGW
ncbi:MAG TPA: efflux transporter outer membrane subunit [Luteolibacter sp.]